MPKRTLKLPTGYSNVMSYLRVKGASDAIAFYKMAFGAKERYRLNMGGRVGHAEIEINGAVVMLGDEFPEMGALGPKSRNGTTVTLCVMVANADAALAKAVAAGAKVLRPASDEFYGYRSASIEDPFGHHWMLQQYVEKVEPKEMQKRLDALMAQMASAPAKASAKKPAKRKG